MIAGVENKELAVRSFHQAASGAPIIMPATGELIRLINFVDDINTTVRRIQASLHGVDAEERKRLAESLRSAGTKIAELVQEVEKSK
jgi:hypothetical protein